MHAAARVTYQFICPDSVGKIATSSTSFCFALVLLMLCSAQVSARSYFGCAAVQIACNNEPFIHLVCSYEVMILSGLHITNLAQLKRVLLQDVVNRPRRVRVTRLLPRCPKI